jgi:hypothetical protein
LMFLLIKPIHERATVLELSLMIAEMHKSSRAKIYKQYIRLFQHKLSLMIAEMHKSSRAKYTKNV